MKKMKSKFILLAILFFVSLSTLATNVDVHIIVDSPDDTLYVSLGNKELYKKNIYQNEISKPGTIILFREVTRKIKEDFYFLFKSGITFKISPITMLNIKSIYIYVSRNRKGEVFINIESSRRSTMSFRNKILNIIDLKGL